MTSGDKYSLINRDNLMQPIQMQLSQKQKAFCEFSFPFLKSTLNFEHFQGKHDPHSYVFLILRTPKKVVRYMSEMSRFRGLFDRQHSKPV